MSAAIRKQRVFALAMALLMLITSTGIAMDMHFCGDQLKGVALIGTAKTCHEKAAAPACHKVQEELPSSAQECEKDCCSRHMVYAQLDADGLASPKAEAAIPQFTSLAILACLALKPAAEARSAAQHFLDYKPPQRQADIVVLLQNFRI